MNETELLWCHMESNLTGDCDVCVCRLLHVPYQINGTLELEVMSLYCEKCALSVPLSLVHFLIPFTIF